MSAAPKFINMKKQTKNPFLDEIELDLDEILNNGVFVDNDNDEIQISSFNRKTTKKQPGMRNKSQQKAGTQQRCAVSNMFSISDGFKQQMSSVLIADDIVKSMK